jgi:hypothetical protein
MPKEVFIKPDSRPNRLEENLGAANVVLTDADLDKIERAAAEIQVEGERYPPRLCWINLGGVMRGGYLRSRPVVSVQAPPLPR